MGTTAWMTAVQASGSCAVESPAIRTHQKQQGGLTNPRFTYVLLGLGAVVLCCAAAIVLLCVSAREKETRGVKKSEEGTVKREWRQCRHKYSVSVCYTLIAR